MKRYLLITGLTVAVMTTSSASWDFTNMFTDVNDMMSDMKNTINKKAREKTTSNFLFDMSDTMHGMVTNKAKYDTNIVKKKKSPSKLTVKKELTPPRTTKSTYFQP